MATNTTTRGEDTTNVPEKAIVNSFGGGGSGVSYTSPADNGSTQTTLGELTALPSENITDGIFKNQYGLTGNITFENPPSTGKLTVTDGVFKTEFNAPFTSPQIYFMFIQSDAKQHTVTAKFSENLKATSVNYTAPASV